MPNKWVTAVVKYNNKHKTSVFTIPKKGTAGYAEVKKIEKGLK